MASALFSNVKNINQKVDAQVLTDDVIATICQVRTELNAADISGNTRFDVLGLSSLELTEVILELEERYEVEIDISAIDASDSLKTVGDIVKTLEKILNSKN